MACGNSTTYKNYHLTPFTQLNAIIHIHHSRPNIFEPQQSRIPVESPQFQSHLPARSSIPTLLLSAPRIIILRPRTRWIRPPAHARDLRQIRSRERMRA